MKPTPLSIGIPYRDEGQNFALHAGGLIAAIQELPAELPREIIFCVNGSREGFSEELTSLVNEEGFDASQARVIDSSEGKLNAQRAIIQERRLQGYIAFVDSDVVLEKNVLRLLWEILESDAHCMVAYGQPVPIFPARLNYIHHLLRVHYSLRERVYRRPFFHGRAFMLRNWFFEDPRPLQGVSPQAAERLQLKLGPLVDDIVMSRIAVTKWGAGAIREVQAANVFFDPPDTIIGMYAGALRVALEVQRLDMLYPEQAQLQKTVFSKLWKAHGLAGFSFRLRAMHTAYHLLDTLVKKVASVHVWLVKIGLLHVRTLWIRVPGTKSFARIKRPWQNFKRLNERPSQRA